MTGASRWSPLVGFCACVFLFSPCTDVAADPKRDHNAEQINVLIQTANGMIRQIQKTCQQFGLRYVGPEHVSSTGLDVSQHWESPVEARFFTGPQAVLRWGEVGFSFCNSDDGLTDYDNNAIYDLSEIRSFYDTQPKPKWNEEQVKEVGEAFKKIFFTSKRVFIGLPHVTYEPGYEIADKKLKYCKGQWNITWWRTDHQGHEFISGDHISMILKEGLSPLMVTVLLNTPFKEMNAEPITEQAAIKIAQSDVDSRWTKWKTTTGASNYSEFKASHYRFKDASLQVVLPYDPRFSPKAAQQRTPARLVWQVVFDLVYPPNTPAPRSEKDGATSQVDAFSGKALTYDLP